MHMQENMIEGKTELLIDYIAWRFITVSNDEIMSFLSYYNVNKYEERKKLIETLIKKGTLVEDANNYNYYHLSYENYWSILWDIRYKDYSAFEKIYKLFCERRWRTNNNDSLRDELIVWACSSSTTKFNPHFGLTDFNIQLFAFYYFHPEWFKLINSSAIDFFIASFESLVEVVAMSMSSEYIESYYKICDKIIEEKPLYKDIVNARGLFITQVLTGKINEEPAILDTNTAEYISLSALRLQHKGEYTKAITLYRKVIKANGNKYLLNNPYYALAYILALKEIKKPSTENTFHKIYKSLGHNAEFLHIELILAYFLEIEIYDIVEAYVIAQKKNQINNLNQTLFLMIAYHYGINKIDSKILNLVSDAINKDHFKLLQLEASSEFPRFKEKQQTLIGELEIKPLLKKKVILEPWEKTIENVNIVLNATKPKENKTNGAVVTSRIYYLLNEFGDFTPRLQKSKDGINWSAGRNIALKTFRACTTEGMSDVDKKIATYVKETSSWYNGGEYELCGKKVFAALINHPMVFDEANPDINIQITKGEAHLQVNKTSLGFKISHNITKEIDDKVVVVRENSTLYKVFELSTAQATILSSFSATSTFPLKAQKELVELLTRVASVISVHSDLLGESASLKTIKADSKITIQLIPYSDGIKVEFFVKPFVDVAPYCKAGEGTSKCIATKNGEQLVAQRNLKKEKENYKTLLDIVRTSLKDSEIDDLLFFDDYYSCLDLIESIQSKDDLVRLEWPEGSRISIKKLGDFGKININVKKVGSWFDVNGDVQVDEKLQLSIAQLLEKARNSKGRFIEISPGEYIALSQNVKTKLSELDSRLIKNKNKLQLSPFNTAAISGIEDENVKLKLDKEFLNLRKRIEDSDKLKIEIPSTLQCELREYQEDGYRWLARLASWGAGACLADDMGLGKTVQSIALMLNRAESGATLIVAPASVVPNWKNELIKFAPTLNYKVLYDNLSTREDIVENAGAYDVIISTYGLLNTEAALLSKKDWNVILLDEAHTIKNRDTKMSKAAMNLKGDFRLLLTGTPIQNHLGEIWNLFAFANPGLLGSFEHFNERFIQPIEKERDKYKQLQLKKMLQPFLLRRTKSEVLDELPIKTEITYEVTLSDEERAFYENIRQSAIANIENGTLNPLQTIVEITKLRQAACHPSLVNKALNLPSSKINALLELTSNLIANKHRALVFSQFTSFLEYVRQELDAKGVSYLYLDGGVSIKEREKLVEKFQKGDYPIFLISLKAGGTGLNLTAADYVIHLDPWWNPAIEDQASDRSHRIGQTRPVTIYKLIAKQTIEEKIIELHKSKKSLADSLLEGSNMSHKLTSSEMLELLF